jgi:FkbM family methyltransferase
MVEGTATVQSGPMARVTLRTSKDVSHAHIRGTYEYGVQEAIASSVRTGMVCYDLGASIGYMSLLMAHCGASQVFSFEPAPHAAGVLAQQAAANKWTHRIKHVPLAVSDCAKTVTFSLTDNAYGSRIGEFGQQHMTVQCTTLDTFAAEHGYPDFIKMDVEGEEVSVLRGATAVLRRKPTLCIEIHGREQAIGVSEILAQYGYTLSLITEGGMKPYQAGEAKPGDVQVLAVANTTD